MKKILKITGITIVSVVLLLYVTLVFIIPNVINLDKYKTDIQKLAKEQTTLDINYDNAKITVTPLLSAGIKADNIHVNLPDNSELLKADSFIGRVSLPHLIFLTVKVTKAELENIVLNIEIADGKEYKLEKIISDIIKKQNELAKKQSPQNTDFDMSVLKIDIPEIKLVNYSALINDLKVNNYLKLRGDELLIGYKNGKTASLKTIAELYVNENKNITANIDIDTALPKIEASETNQENISDFAEKKNLTEQKEIPFINPVAIYKAYDLKTNINTKLRIREKDNKYISNGYLKIDDLTIMLAGLQLPSSNIHINTSGTKAEFDSEIYTAPNEKLSLNGLINYGKHPEADIKIVSDEIQTQNIINLVHAALNSVNIKNELNIVQGSGYLKADANINTDFNKLKSNGQVLINNCELINSKDKSRIAKINSTISLDNNIVKFMNTTVEVLETIFKVDGTINEKSYADISVIAEKLPVLKLFTMFAPQEIKNNYKVNSGVVNISADVKGQLTNPSGSLNVSMNNLSMTDIVNQISYINNLLDTQFTSDFKTFKGTLKNHDFKLVMNGANIQCPLLEAAIGDKDITINPAKLVINNSTNVNFEGGVKNYIKNPVFDFLLNGAIRTQDIKQLLGQDIGVYLNNKGTLPIEAKITGDGKQQTITASVNADANNYITPLNITSAVSKPSVIKTAVDLKGDKLTIRDTGFYVKEGAKETEIVGIEGNITKLNTANPSINMIKVKIPNDINASICVFPNSKVSAKGNMYITGDLNSPKIRGNVDIWNLSIPEIMVKMEKAVANIEGNDLDINVNKLTANGSDYSLVINADLSPSKYFTIKTLNLISNLTDADKIMKVTEALDKALPKPNSASYNVSSASVQNDIPVVIKDGTIDIKSIKSGNIILTETTGKISLSKNILYLNNLITTAFAGKVRGDISMNMMTSDIKTILKGTGVNVEKALLDAASMKDTLTGTMDFDADISLKGSTYEEQMNSLKGKVDFTIKNGTLGPFGRIENLIFADNIRQNAFFKTAIGAIVNQITTFDTTHYSVLNGNLTFNNGVAQINPITSTGDVMSTYIFGSYNLLKNTMDITLRGRLGSQVSESLGTLSLINPINLSKKAVAINPLLGNVLMLFNQQISEAELNQIPKLGKEYTDTNTTKFQAVLKGDALKPASLVKSFKWLALKSEIENAQKAMGDANLGITSLDKEELKNTAKQKVKESIDSSLTEEQKKQIKQGKEAVDTVKNIIQNKEQVKNNIKEQAQQAKKNFLNQLKEQVEKQ